MIGKITAPHGERVEGLIYYMFGPGRAKEHTDRHIVAGWRHPAVFALAAAIIEHVLGGDREPCLARRCPSRKHER